MGAPVTEVIAILGLANMDSNRDGALSTGEYSAGHAKLMAKK